MSNDTTTALNSYLSFRLGEELFAVNVGKVLNILEMSRITKVPNSPEYMKGVINLRGSVLPVIDMRVKFGLELTDDTVDTCILVLDIELDNESVKVGALVDAVSEVLEIEAEEIEDSPTIGSKYKSEFIQGMWKNEGAFIMLLHIDMIFTLDEIRMVQESTERKAVKPAKAKEKVKKPAEAALVETEETTK